jgi:hypothetical protein
LTTTELMMARNSEYERLFLDQLAKDAHRRYGVDAEPFASAVRERLTHGQERFGDDSFLTSDNHLHIAEEAPDLVGYALLEIQRINHLGLNVRDGVFHHLYEAALAATVADWHARQARRLARMGE